MRLRGLIVVAFLIGACWASLAESNVVIIHAGRLVDTGHKQVRERVSIIIKDARINSVEEGFTSQKGAEIIDLSSATVLPGLIDCHKHLTAHLGTGSYFQDLVTENIADSAFYAAANARTTLLNGFTSVRDVGARATVDVSLKRAIEKQSVIGPRVWAAGEILGPTGGHSDPGNGVA